MRQPVLTLGVNALFRGAMLAIVYGYVFMELMSVLRRNLLYAAVSIGVTLACRKASNGGKRKQACAICHGRVLSGVRLPSEAQSHMHKKMGNTVRSAMSFNIAQR